jgi:hypothetical protein
VADAEDGIRKSLCRGPKAKEEDGKGAAGLEAETGTATGAPAAPAADAKDAKDAKQAKHGKHAKGKGKPRGQLPKDAKKPIDDSVAAAEGKDFLLKPGDLVEYEVIPDPLKIGKFKAIGLKLIQMRQGPAIPVGEALKGEKERLEQEQKAAAEKRKTEQDAAGAVVAAAVAAAAAANGEASAEASAVKHATKDGAGDGYYAETKQHPRERKVVLSLIPYASNLTPYTMCNSTPTICHMHTPRLLTHSAHFTVLISQCSFSHMHLSLPSSLAPFLPLSLPLSLSLSLLALSLYIYISVLALSLSLSLLPARRFLQQDLPSSPHHRRQPSLSSSLQGSRCGHHHWRDGHGFEPAQRASGGMVTAPTP